jgi:xeroderma pigmentosum group C-complementing protein
MGKWGHMRRGASGSRSREVIDLDGEPGGGQEDQRITTSIPLIWAVPLIWAEVACGSSAEARWMHVDAVRGRVDEPSSVLPAVKGAGKARRSYMMASEAPSQSIMDVSARYLAAASIASLVAAKKGEGKWWEETIEIFDQSLMKSGPQESKSQLNDASTSSPINIQDQMHGALRDQREKEELKKMAEDQLRKQVPTSIDGFKSHPFFVLKRHIQKYEAMKPGSKMQGMFKGEVYYDRSELSPLHTADRWRREGREVMADELRKPYKLAPKRKVPQAQPAASQTDGRGGYHMYGPKKGGGTAGSSSSVVREDLPAADAQDVPCDDVMEEEEGVKASGASSKDTDEPQTLLYGLWQTCEWKPPVARDGIVPKNERGSVECPPLLKSLPLGTVHLNQYPNLQPVCRALGVDFGPALVGWEVSGGRMLPRFEGVVICLEFEAQVVNACLEREVAKSEAIRQKAERMAKQGWHKLVEAMRTRTRLDANYKAQPQSLKAREVLTINDTSDEEMEVQEGSAKRKGTVDEERDASAVTKRLREDYATKNRVGEDPQSSGKHAKNLNGIEREEI